MVVYDAKTNDSHNYPNSGKPPSNPFLTSHEIARSYLSKPVPRWVLGLHTLAAISSFISIVMLSYSAANEKDTSYDTEMFLAMGVYIVLPFYCLSFIWSVVSVIFATMSRIRLHPAFYVSFDLLLWLGMLTTLCLALVFYQHREAIRIAAHGLGMLNVIFHFAIMVWACRVVDLARRSSKKLTDDIQLGSRA